MPGNRGQRGHAGDNEDEVNRLALAAEKCIATSSLYVGLLVTLKIIILQFSA